MTNNNQKKNYINYHKMVFKKKCKGVRNAYNGRGIWNVLFNLACTGSGKVVICLIPSLEIMLLN